ncbi:Piso0_002848 [Millerozyma farinosa CBS 7064]|uniref:Piso0_002848 protein n=1 Tax=Pichia sorbitophila (strain ATCC MYA-4447 / BCRC 22081 / CBS 7064 / NBRC 10061 / NRRL Y-12695) TaxID=559304 RepID=G8YG50_PICSO|nr:Piso0_002848 [Millerozyma farinosa CBS 7064]
MTKDSASVEIIERFLKKENQENDTLIDILGHFKPAQSRGSLNGSIIRGLFTKNREILVVLHNAVVELQNENANQKEVFKKLVNDFILWIDEGALALFKKYESHLEASDLACEPESELFGTPIQHCQTYIDFTSDAIILLRNPFIVQKLEVINEEFAKLFQQHNDLKLSYSLNNISFKDIRQFPTTHHSSVSVHASHDVEKVASFFKLDQIIERTGNEHFFIDLNNGHYTDIELVLLNYSDPNSKSLAILAIPPSEKEPRSLMYPPFRTNEFSICFERECSRLVFRYNDFAGLKNFSEEGSLRIGCKNQQLLLDWFDKLNTIFPTYDSNFALNDLSTGTRFKGSNYMSGLGIGVLSTSNNALGSKARCSPSDGKGSSYDKDSENEDHSKVSDLPIDGDDHISSSPTKFQSNSSLHSEADSSYSTESIKNQYSRSLEIINEKLSHSSVRVSKNEHNDDQNKFIKSVRRNFLNQDDSLLENSNFRPSSSRGELDYIDQDVSVSELKQEKVPVMTQHFASMPDLPSNGSSERIYQLPSGSAIDLENFGKNHEPGFRDLTSISGNKSNNDKTAKRRSIFDIFKKPKSKFEYSAANIDSEESGKTSRNSSSSTLLRDTVDNVSEGSDSTVPKDIKNSVPSAFALPSSTSMYFFKPYKDKYSSSNTSLPGSKPKSDEIDELQVPQYLKDLINSDESIDFYVSPSEPKTIKVSKWKHKYGKWELLTTNENLFLKIVVNYNLGKGWLVLFKEEYDEELDEILEKAILLMNITDNETEITQSSALDVQFSSTDSITQQKVRILIRCLNGATSSAILINLKNAFEALFSSGKSSALASRLSSSVTLSSSLMDQKEKPSTSSTFTSFYSDSASEDKTASDKVSEGRGAAQDVSNDGYASLDASMGFKSNIINDTFNTKLNVLNGMTVRLQRQLESFDHVNNPSSWKIIGMYTLGLTLITDRVSEETFFHFSLASNDDESQDFDWLVNENEIESRVGKIGKAGLLMTVSDNSIFMVETKGKKEFKVLSSIFW